MPEHGQFRPFIPNGQSNGRPKSPERPKPAVPAASLQSAEHRMESWEQFIFGVVMAGVIQTPMAAVSIILSFLDLTVKRNFSDLGVLCIALCSLAALYPIEIYLIMATWSYLSDGKRWWKNLADGLRALCSDIGKNMTRRAWLTFTLSFAFGFLCMYYRIYRYGWSQLRYDLMICASLFSSGGCVFDLALLYLLLQGAISRDARDEND